MTPIKDLMAGLTPEEIVKRVNNGELPFDSEQEEEAYLGKMIPNTTATPNEIVDNWLHLLTGAEYKVLSYIIRKTFGYGKGNEGDQISLSQIMNGTKTTDKKTGQPKLIDHGTGLTKTTALAAIRKLEAYKLLKVKRERIDNDTRDINYYRLNTRDQY